MSIYTIIFVHEFEYIFLIHDYLIKYHHHMHFSGYIIVKLGRILAESLVKASPITILQYGFYYLTWESYKPEGRDYQPLEVKHTTQMNLSIF